MARKELPKKSPSLLNLVEARLPQERPPNAFTIREIAEQLTVKFNRPISIHTVKRIIGELREQNLLGSQRVITKDRVNRNCWTTAYWVNSDGQNRSV